MGVGERESAWAHVLPSLWSHHCATPVLPLSVTTTHFAGGNHSLLRGRAEWGIELHWPLRVHGILRLLFPRGVQSRNLNELEIHTLWEKYTTSVLNRYRLSFHHYSPNSST